jgi:hypothetical protein
VELPFIVGGKYRNRIGEYEVLQLDEPSMVIRYSDGRTHVTKVDVQARIWENIQAEESVTPPPEKTTPPPRPPSRKDRGGRDFHGLQERDFQRGVTGTLWRARPKLGGQLARVMSDTTRYSFESYAIYRRAELHIARPECYTEKIRRQEAKFAFDLDPERARYGFYIEKNDGPLDDTWDWTRFLNALAANAMLQKTILTAMARLALQWEVYVYGDNGWTVRVTLVEGGLQWALEDGEKAEDITWFGFIERLKGLEADKWCDLYLCAHMDKEKAIAEGISLANPVTEVYRALLPLYEASTRAA